jgi:hypothetical protein
VERLARGVPLHAAPYSRALVPRTAWATFNITTTERAKAAKAARVSTAEQCSTSWR